MSYEAFAYYYDSLMDPDFYKDYVQFIKEHADFQTVLELGCGTGEIAVRLAKRKKEVYATDLSKDMLEVARMKASRQNVELMLGRIDMRDFIVDQKLDLVLCLCDSLNYIIERDEVKKIFVNCFNAIKDDGCFIFDVDSIYKMENILKDYLEENDDPDFYFKWKVDSLGYGHVVHHVEIIDKIENEHVSEEHIQKTLTVDEYKNMLLEVGFKDIEIYSDFGEYHDDCERVIFVCRKEVK